MIRLSTLPQRWSPIVPGVAFIAVGALILIEPKVLVWLVAAASIVMGIVMLMLANFVRKVGVRVQRHTRMQELYGGFTYIVSGAAP